MILSQPLIAPSIYLRTLYPTDIDENYLSWVNDYDVIKFLELRFNTPKSVNALISYVISCNQSEDVLLAGIFLKNTNSHIGNIKLGPINIYHQLAEVGLMLGDKNQWGKGYGSTAISMLSFYAFNHLCLHKLTAGCYEINYGSKKAFINSGYTEEGCRLSQCVSEGKRIDLVLFGKINPIL